MLKLGINTVLFKGFGIKQALKLIKLAGYDGAELAVTIYLAEAPASGTLEVSCDSRFAFTEGQKAVLKRMRAITPEAKVVFAAAVSNHLQLTPELLRYAGTASYITEDPAGAEKYLKELSPESLQKDLSEYKLPEEFSKKLMAQLAIWE